MQLRVGICGGHWSQKFLWCTVSYRKEFGGRGTNSKEFFTADMKEMDSKPNVQSTALQQGAFVIPAIDIIDGKCVRLIEGDYSQKKIYNERPLEVAKQFEDAGLKRLHLVDLDGAKAGAVKNWKVLEAIAGRTSLIIDFGGGIKTEKDVQVVLDSGSSFATVGSIAVKSEDTFSAWLTK